MKLFNFFLVNIIIMNFSFALSLDDRRKKIINIIDEELSEVSRLSKQAGDRNPDHLLRMAELNLEKARLWREKENQVYISLPDATRRQADKKKYFQKSAQYFERANKLCLIITKRFKKYKDISDVYYILGFNAKEAGKLKTAQKYFLRSSKKSRKNSITEVKSKISLAEIYYNKKKYKKAIPLYEKALSQYQDKWWTKDSFNLAWCYFRANRYDNAISKMQQVFKLSTNKKYIDMREQVERDIGLFFATAGRINEGISFYKKIGIDFTDQLLRISVTMKSKGNFTLAEKTLLYALKYEKKKNRFAEIYIEQLDLYQRYAKTKLHLNTAQKLLQLQKQNLLSANQLKVLKYQTAKMGAVIQKQVADKTYRRLKKKRTQKAYQAIEYFDILAEIDVEKKHEHRFIQGETSFIIEDFARALSFYNSAFDLSVQKKNEKYKKLSMEGMLSCLGHNKLSRTIKEKYYASVYEKYLSHYPNEKRSKSIYQKLFKVYFDQGLEDKAKIVLDRFVKYYPSDWKIQEAMISNLMEKARTRKQNNIIRAWITQIDAGTYKVSKRYAKKLRELLTTMQIEDVQLQLRKGNKKEALLGYHKVLKDPHSTKRSKVNAKYNLAALYYELGATENAFDWSVKAIQEMSPAETVKFSDSFLTISSFLFMRLEFKKSADLSQKIIRKICHKKTRQKTIAFKNASFLYLAEGNLTSANEMIQLGYKCKVPSTHIDNIRFELLKDYSQMESWINYEEQVLALAKNKANWPKLILPVDKLKLINLKQANTQKASFFEKQKWKYYSYAKKKRQDIPLDALDLVADHNIYELEQLQKKIYSTQLSFPFKVFQARAAQIRNLLDSMILNANKIQKIGSGEGIVKAYSMLIETHNKLAQIFETFKPKGLTKLEKESISTFYKQMKKQAQELRQTAKNYQKDVWKVIEQNQILSHANNQVFPESYDVAIRYWYPRKSLIMDRGGKQ